MALGSFLGLGFNGSGGKPQLHAYSHQLGHVHPDHHPKQYTKLDADADLYHDAHAKPNLQPDGDAKQYAQLDTYPQLHRDALAHPDPKQYASGHGHANL